MDKRLSITVLGGNASLAGWHGIVRQELGVGCWHAPRANGAEVLELSLNFGDGLRVQAAAVWDFEDAELAATSIPSVNLTP